MLLDGDRNLGSVPTIGTFASAITLTSGQQWPAGVKAWAWTANELHLKVGNIGMADGSCQQTTPASLWAAMLNSTNGSPVQFPYYNFPN